MSCKILKYLKAPSFHGLYSVSWISLPALMSSFQIIKQSYFFETTVNFYKIAQ